MSEKRPEGHPIVVMAAGGFLGGLVAGGNNAGALGFIFLSLAASYGLLFLLGHIEKNDKGGFIGTLLGLSTMIPLPCGLVGMMLGKAWWGS